MRTLRRRLLGLAFFGVCALFLVVTIGKYQQRFETFTWVELNTDTAGASLPVNSEVRARGVEVGTVRDVFVRDGHTVIRMGLKPEQARQLPGDVTARILPKTLFGQRYVALQVPAGQGGTGTPGASALRDGATIRTDTSGNATELNQLFDKLLPLLRAVPPEDLNATLGALANGLSGNGKNLNTAFEQFTTIFTRVNAVMPDLQASLRSLATVTDTYADAVPDLITALDTFRTTNTTVVSGKQAFHAFWTSVADGAGRTAGLLEANRSELVTVANKSHTTLTILARYSPEFGCTFERFATLLPEANRIVGEGTNQPGARISMIIANSRGRYLPNQDEPRWFDDRGPACYNAAKGKPTPGYKGGPHAGGSFAPPLRNVGPQDGRFQLPEPNVSAPSQMPTVGVAAQNSRATRIAFAAASGTDANDVPEWLTAAFVPALAGKEVEIR
ncbi:MULTISPECIES: MCE family protein [Tsukamurella]|uniref:MCE family protein n=2 Tax=Tsukamurella TaxID=2060 RepID=A0A5C5S2L2_9ACTN|nr:MULTISPECIES: MCE family protein [Tsukamurella]NMD54622.1 MCE family protein [Tsukamurella columbiensis]TWS28541.1 MCE family protein [Tsukamurella conjunctivitidis]